MDKNQIIGIVLMVLLYIGYIWYTTPTEEDRLAAIAAQEQQIEQARLDSIAAVEEAEFQAQLREQPRHRTPPVRRRWMPRSSDGLADWQVQPLAKTRPTPSLPRA